MPSLARRSRTLRCHKRLATRALKVNQGLAWGSGRGLSMEHGLRPTLLAPQAGR